MLPSCDSEKASRAFFREICKRDCTSVYIFLDLVKRLRHAFAMFGARATVVPGGVAEGLQIPPRNNVSPAHAIDAFSAYIASTRPQKIFNALSSDLSLFALFPRALSPSGYPFTGNIAAKRTNRFAGKRCGAARRGVSFKANSSSVSRKERRNGGVASRRHKFAALTQIVVLGGGPAGGGGGGWAAAGCQDTRTPARDRRGKYARGGCFLRPPARPETGFKPARPARPGVTR